MEFLFPRDGLKPSDYDVTLVNQDNVTYLIRYCIKENITWNDLEKHIPEGSKILSFKHMR